MSNITATDPLYLDTASTSATVFTDTRRIRKIIWNSGASGVVGDQLLIKDAAANVWLDGSLNVAKGSEQYDFGPAGFPIKGLILHTMSHGVVTIYYVP